jgi:hypothetical protein
MLIVRLFLARKRDSATQTPRPAIILRAFRGRGHANKATPFSVREFPSADLRIAFAAEVSPERNTAFSRG